MSVQHRDRSASEAGHTPRRPTRAAIRETVADLLQEPPESISDDDDLTMLGIDSMGVMTLANGWREGGLDVTFGQLIEHPTIAAWHTRLDTCAEPAASPAAATAGDEGRPHPLAPMQLAYWVGRQDGMPLSSGSHFYFEFDAAGVDPRRLDVALRALGRRHSMLRARFAGDATQTVGAGGCALGGVHDFRETPAEQIPGLLDGLRERLSHQRMDIAAGQVLDVRLSLLPGGRTRMHLDIDMLVSDATSFRIVVGDLAALYLDPGAPLGDLNYDYPRYLADRRARVRPQAAADEAYWRERLATLPGAPQLPLAAPARTLSDARTVTRTATLDPAGYAALGARARSHGVTVPMVLATAYADVLAAWSTNTRFLLNLPMFDRDATHPDVGLLVGDFTNLLLLEVDAAAGPTFADRARSVQQRFRTDAAHGGYSGTEVLRDLAQARPDEPVSAPVVFTSALSMGELFTDRVREAFGTPGWMSSQTAGVWLDLQVVEQDAGLLMNWETVDELFAPGVPAEMFAAFVRRADELCRTDTDWANPLTVPLPPEQARVRARVNDTARPAPATALHVPFFEHARVTPDAVAVTWGRDGSLSYAALAAGALRLAGRLRAAGAAVGEPVAVTLPKGPDQVIAVLGVLAAGCSYVPVGVDQPVVRRDDIYRRSGARFAVTAAGPAAGVPTPGVIRLIGVGSPADPLDEPVPTAADQVAYTIFTSGSTGRPKGVDVSHGAARNTVDALNDRFGIGPQDRTLAVSGLDFDLSVYDLFGPLCAGGAVICVGEDERRDAARWSELAERHHATVLNSVPAVLDMLLTVREEQHRPLGLRLLLLGGDWVGLDLPGRAHRRDPDCRFVALGGTTETAIHSTVCEVGEVPGQWRSIPYGVPLPNQQCRVVDAGGRDRPDGVAGELWIGGLGVAEGYHGDPDRTADRFVRHDSTRWYRTGDLARYHPDGTLEFLGRADFQVKISGYRIEPGEIQHALEAHPRVSAAVVCTVGETAPRLVAMAAASGVTAGEVREFLTLRLPPYMVPERIEMVAALPLSRNGKVDRAAVAAGLRDAGTVPDGTASEAAHGDVEVALAALWAELLAVSRVGRTDSFFALGGDSLLATRLLTRLGAAGLHGAQLGTLFRGPTLGEFAATLTRGAPQRLTHVVADPAARGEPFPATEVQRAYWLGRNPEFTLGGVGSSWYWEFDGSGVDLDRLERCWNQVVRRHEMMRAVFDDDARQRILPETPWVRLPVDDAGPGGEQESLRRLRESMAHRVFDVRQWPLFDVRAVRYGDRCRIGFGFDYIVLDALSIMIIFWELSALYRDPDAVLPPLGVSFRDYVLQVRPEPETRARDERYWLDRIATLPPAPRLPMAIDPALLDEPRFTRWEFHLSAERWRDLLARAAGHGLTPSTVLATAFAEVLATWSAGPQVALNLTMFDRREVHPDINNILGDFTSLLLVGHHSRPGRSWADTARELQQQVWDALEHSSVPAVWVLREMARTAGVAELLMPVVFTSTLGVSDQLAELDIPFGEQVWGLSQTPQVSLDCQVVERDGGLSINWDVVADLFPDGVVDAMFGSYRALVERLATASWDEPAVPLLPPAQAAIRAAVGTPVRPESGDLLHHGFFARAADRPGAPALHVEGGAAVTYGDLADLARRTASTLISRGVRPGDPVAVCLPKGAGQIVAVLAVLAAGGVYVPIGAEQPAVRRNRILRAAGARIVIAEPGPDEAVWDPSAEVVDPLTAARAARLEHLVEVAGADLAYVIFTSGSTGEPKGVEISHRSAVNTVEDVNDRYGVGPADVGLALSALDFDLSVYDIFGLLGAGGSLVLIDDAGRREARRWAELVTGHGVTVWNTVPALLDMLLVAGADDLPPATLRLVLVSGDWVGLDLPGRLAAAAPLAELVALGGATEAAIWSNAYDVSGPLPDWQSIPYGLPLRNQRYRVVGENGADCPDWVPGELWIGGTGVAAGYRGDPARTAERFVEHLGVRWYRTGDLGRYRPGGLLEFLGRLDQQVKVRGNRIELGEVETALRRHPGLEGAVAGTAGERTARRLVAFVTAAEPVDEADVRAFVTELLPGYMVPEQILQVPAFPLSANGKVDRAALAVAVPQSGPAGREPPRAGAEREVAALWSELLGLPTVDRADSFFAVGGDSLTATRLVELVRERMGPRLTLRQIFAAPTLAVLAALVQSERTAVRSPSADPIEEGVL